MQTLDIGEVAPITTTWWNKQDVPTNPTAIALTITKPSGTVVSKAKADMHQGATTDVWIYDQTVDQLGAWRVHAVGTVGTDTVTQDDVFLVGAGSEPSTGPCEPWTSWDAVAACGPASLSDVSPSQREYAVDVASEILYNLSGRVYPGICTVTRSLCLSCRTCLPATCGCEPVNGYYVDLGIAAPVWGAWDVIADGVTLPASAYTVHDRRYLVRTDGELWPVTGNGQTSLMDPNTFRATWAYGRKVPVGGQQAAQLFVTEIAKLCVGDASCQIPQRVTNVNREGMSFTILDSMKMIEEGRTGIALIDLWLVSDKVGRKSKPRIFAPGAHNTTLIG